MSEVPLYAGAYNLLGVKYAPLATEGIAIPYRGTSLIRKRTPLGPYHRPMPRVLGWS